MKDIKYGKIRKLKAQFNFSSLHKKRSITKKGEIKNINLVIFKKYVGCL